MSSRKIPRLLQTPAVLLLLVWMLIPLGMTLYFSFIRYVLNSLRKPEWTTPSISNWRGFGNYEFVLNSKDFLFAIQNSLFIVGSILFLTVILGVLIAVLINKSFPGQGIVRVLLISPFFIMPAVNAVLWINMILDPVLGLNGLAVEGINNVIASLHDAPVVGGFFSLWPKFDPISFRATQTSAYAVIMMVTWQWTPFAVLIFMTSLQSEDEQQKEAAILDGASRWSQFRFLTLPHLGRPIAIGNKNLPYLIGEFANNNIGAASATGIFAVILANIVAIFLLRMVGKTLME